MDKPTGVTIIAGSRNLDFSKARQALEQLVAELGHDIDTVLDGGARGVDAVGWQWAEEHGIPVRRKPALWDVHGRAAGPIRNREMAEEADCLILIWDGKSRGSANMKRCMEELGKPIFERVV